MNESLIKRNDKKKKKLQYIKFIKELKFNQLSLVDCDEDLTG